MQLSAHSIHLNRPDSVLIKVHDLFAVLAPYRVIAAARNLPAEAEANKWLRVYSGFQAGAIDGPSTVRRHRCIINTLIYDVLRTVLTIEGKRKKGFSVTVKDSPPVR